MNKTYERKYHMIEQNNWWFVSRRNFIMKLVKGIVNKDSKILEVGCSTGKLLELLKKKGYKDVIGIDISKEAVKKSKCNVLLMDATKTKFKDNQFDLIIASDVLEHMKDDLCTLYEWNRILKRNGYIIVFTPAFNFLWSKHDEMNHHYRRYTKYSLRNALLGSGYDIHRLSYWNTFLFLPVLLFRLSKSRKLTVNRYIDRLFCSIMNVESFLLGFMNLPIGVSVFAIGVKR